MILPLDFSEIFIFFEIIAFFRFNLILGCDLIKFWNHKPEE